MFDQSILRESLESHIQFFGTKVATIARRIGVSREFLSKFRHGHVNMGFNNYQKLDKYLKVRQIS